jgi:hypothetical protein
MYGEQDPRMVGRCFGSASHANALPWPGKLGHGNELGHPAPCRVDALSSYRVEQASLDEG